MSTRPVCEPFVSPAAPRTPGAYEAWSEMSEFEALVSGSQSDDSKKTLVGRPCVGGLPGCEGRGSGCGRWAPRSLQHHRYPHFFMLLSSRQRSTMSHSFQTTGNNRNPQMIFAGFKACRTERRCFHRCTSHSHQCANGSPRTWRTRLPRRPCLDSTDEDGMTPGLRTRARNHHTTFNHSHPESDTPEDVWWVPPV